MTPVNLATCSYPALAERKDNLYSQSVATTTGLILSSASTPTSAIGRAPPSGFYMYAVRIPQSITNFSLPKAFINSHFRVVSKSDLLPLFEKQVLIGGSHPSLPKYFSYVVTYWRLIIYIISRTNVPVYPY